VVYAPLRKATVKRTDMFRQTQETVTYKHSTTMTNTKDVPVTVALVDTVPHCSELLVKVRYINTRYTLQSTVTCSTQYALQGNYTLQTPTAVVHCMDGALKLGAVRMIAVMVCILTNSSCLWHTTCDLMRLLVQVTLKQPATVHKLLKQPEDSDASLVTAALKQLSFNTATSATDDDTISDSEMDGDTGTAAAAGILKVVQTEPNKLLWLVRLLPQSQQVVPFEYTVQGPSDHTLVLG
jgi:hypothetical protein